MTPRCAHENQKTDSGGSLSPSVFHDLEDSRRVPVKNRESSKEVISHPTLLGALLRCQPHSAGHTHTIDTEIKAKRNTMISEFVTFRITKMKAKVKFGVKYLCGHECERSSVELMSIQKRKQNFISGN